MPAYVKVLVSEAEVEKAVTSVPPPEGIKFRRVYFDTDWSGDDAAYAVFAISKKFGIKPAKIRELAKFHNRVVEAMNSLHLDLLAYVHFESAR